MITKHLQETIKYLPDGWFEPTDLYGSPFNRVYWVCNRLTEEGILESRIELLKNPLRTKTYYRKILNEEKSRSGSEGK